MLVMDKLQAIAFRRLNLNINGDDECDRHPHRPELRISADLDADIGGDGAHVSLCLDSLWGQQIRYVALLPSEARKLAHHLCKMADSVDHVAAGVAFNDRELRQQLRDSDDMKIIVAMAEEK